MQKLFTEKIKKVSYQLSGQYKVYTERIYLCLEDGISGFLVGFKQITINFPDCIKYAIIIYYILQSGRNNEYTL